MKRLFWIVVALAALPALTGCGRSANPPPPVRSGLIAAGGLVEPDGEERVIIPQLSGRLAKVFIAEGEAVQAGQLIAEIENSEYRAALAAATAELARRDAELTRL